MILYVKITASDAVMDISSEIPDSSTIKILLMRAG